jgi:hypothetical protein
MPNINLSAMRLWYLIIAGLITVLPAFAGFGDKRPIRWGKVSPAEFNLKPPGDDSTASAMVLCDFCTIDISNRTFYTRHTRIKILNNEGLKYASVEIPYQTKNRHDDFYDLRARTLVMENGRVTDYKVVASQIEDIKINDQWSKRKFTFPNVKPGAIIEFRYEIASLDFEKLDTWYFQREIPVLWSEIRFQIPPPFVYLVTYENNRQLSVGEENTLGQKLQWLYDTKPRIRRMELAKNNDLLYSTSENRYKVWAMNNMKKKIIMKNLPGLSMTPDNMPVVAHYPQVRFHLFESSGNLPRSFRPLLITTRDDYEERGEWAMMHDRMLFTGYIHYRLKTWSQFNDNLLGNSHFNSYLIKTTGSTAFLDSILRQARSGQDRINAIYHFVKKSFKWNGVYALYPRQDFRDFLNTRTGSSAEINLLMVNLLRRAGFQADPLLIRTNDLGLPEKLYPVKDQFNHVIAFIETGGVQYLLDATSGSSDENMLNVKDLGTQGWIVRKENPGWIEIFSRETKRTGEEKVPVFKL